MGQLQSQSSPWRQASLAGDDLGEAQDKSFEIAQFGARQNAQQQLQSILSQRFGSRANVASNLARSIGGFSELDSLRRQQQLSQPLAAFGQQLALGGDGGRF